MGEGHQLKGRKDAIVCFLFLKIEQQRKKKEVFISSHPWILAEVQLCLRYVKRNVSCTQSDAVYLYSVSCV